ncbi:MAG: hypothetical protein ACLGIK_01940 [Gemmatimonadota bacterium]
MHTARLAVRALAIAASVAVFVAVVGIDAHAQLAEVEPGARIRFAAPSRFGAQVTGIVLERHGDTLKVAPTNGAPFLVRILEMERIAISRGKSRLLGAGMGALWGAGINAVLGLSVGLSDCDGCAYQVDAAEATAAFALAGRASAR